ncbi:MAG TPA: M13 family metallopeptidase [Caldimonas sp.]|nr:M13 family metallopeptidase [Caldimonas sp.]
MTEHRGPRLRRSGALVCVALAFAFALALALALAACAQTGSASVPSRRAGIDRSMFDPAVRAQDDFFRHVNGTWLKSAVIPPDKSRIGAFSSLREKTEAQLRTLVEDAARARGDADARRIGDLYDSFIDEAAVERGGLAPLAAELAAIDALPTARALGVAMARLDRLGVDLPIGFYVTLDARDTSKNVPWLGQSGLLLPDRDYYLIDGDARFAQARAALVAYLTRLLALSGAGSDAAAEGDAVLALETALAKGQWTRVEGRDPVKTYNKMPTAALAPLAGAFDWAGYLATTGLAARTSEIVVRQPSYLPAFASLTGSVPLPVWKAYLRTHLLHAYAPYLGKEFVAARFEFSGTTLRGTTENEARWKRGVALVQQAEGEALGKLYVARHFPPASKARMEQLVANLLAAYRESIDSLDWMSAATKKEAQAKLATFRPKIGYPERWIDYGALEIRRDDLVGNVQRAHVFEYERQLAKLGAPVDRDEWRMTPQTVNAYYNASFNEIVFPAAILQPPFFDADADDAVNYGAIGAIIGHEISHGFDDRGSQFDDTGNLRMWWTAEDRERFTAKTRILIDEYSAFSPVPGYTINGALTLGENIADNSGLEIAYKAYHRSLAGKPAPTVDGTSGDERFFYGFAQGFRGKSREAALLSQIKSDPHSPDEFRVNGTVRNHPAFYSTFGVRPGDAMYLPPEQRVSIW